MSVYDNFITYFDRLVKSYAPYKTNKTYQSICALLKDNFFKDSYSTIPLNLTTYVEDQKIESGLYYNLLVGNGYRRDFVKELGIGDKETILDKLMHYQNYSGTLYHFKRICSCFRDKFDVYELYGDTRVYTEEDGKLKRRWVMVGNPIYLVSNPEDIVDDRINDYDEIYNGTPEYFISTTQLNYWYFLAGAIVLPFKTNLVLLVWQNMTEFSILDTIIMATAYSQFQYEYVNVTINNINYDLTIGDVYQLWHYCLIYASGELNNFKTTIKNVIFGISANPPYTLTPGLGNSIEKVIDAYNNIIDKETSDYFIKNFINDNYSQYISNSALTITNIRKKLVFKLNSIVVDYFEYLINSAVNKINGIYAALSVLETIIDDFISTSENPLVGQYQKYLKLLLSKPTTNLKDTITYKLLYEFKPYHTRFIEKNKTKISSKDKLDNAFIKDRVYFVHHVWETSAICISYSYDFKKIYRGKYFMEYDKQTFSGKCTDYNLKIGDLISFSSSEMDIVEGQCSKVQIIDITVNNDIVTNEQYNLILNIKKDTNPDYSKFINSVSNKILNQNEDDAYNYLLSENENINFQYELMLKYLNDYIEHLEDKTALYIKKEDFNNYLINELDLPYEIKQSYSKLFGTARVYLDSDGNECYIYNELTLLNRTLRLAFYLSDDDLYKIRFALKDDNQCEYVMDKKWPCPSGNYDKLTIFSLPPVHENLTGGFWTFSNVETVHYIHCNKNGFDLIYIGDTIYLPDDGLKYGVKVIGKDIQTLNLILDKNYTGTAGTYSLISRFRSGF